MQENKYFLFGVEVMIRRSPDLILLVVVITMVGAIATNIAHGAQIVDRGHNKTHLQPPTGEVNSAYIDTFINSNPYADQDDKQQHLFFRCRQAQV